MHLVWAQNKWRSPVSSSNYEKEPVLLKNSFSAPNSNILWKKVGHIMHCLCLIVRNHVVLYTSSSLYTGEKTVVFSVHTCCGWEHFPDQKERQTFVESNCDYGGNSNTLSHNWFTVLKDCLVVAEKKEIDDIKCFSLLPVPNIVSVFHFLFSLIVISEPTFQSLCAHYFVFPCTI